MERVLLINPEESRTVWTLSGIIDDEPLDIEMIYTVLKENKIDAKIFDIQRDAPLKIEDIIKEYKPTYVYTNGVVKQVPFMKEYMTLSKKINKDIKTIVGGNYAEYNYKDFYNDDVDYVARSYDPYVIVELIKRKGKKLKDLNGLCYKEKDKWKENNIKFTDIRKLPWIDREFFYKHKNQVKYMDIVPIAHIRTAYSCPYKCEFCYRTMLNNRVYSNRDIEDVVNEVESIDCDYIYFIDDDFLVNRERLTKFINLIKKKKIKKQYVCYGRVDFIINNVDIMKELKEIGLLYVIVGLEAASDEFLKKYNKLINNDDGAKCVSILEEIGIRCMGLMIVDLDFTKKDFKNLYNWIKKTGLKRYGLSIYTPLPGSDLGNKYKDRIIEKDLTKFDYVHVVAKPSKMSVRRYYYHYYKLVIKLFLLVKKYGTYDYIDLKKYMRQFRKLLIKH